MNNQNMVKITLQSEDFMSLTYNIYKTCDRLLLATKLNRQAYMNRQLVKRNIADGRVLSKEQEKAIADLWGGVLQMVYTKLS